MILVLKNIQIYYFNAITCQRSFLRKLAFKLKKNTNFFLRRQPWRQYYKLENNAVQLIKKNRIYKNLKFTSLFENHVVHFQIKEEAKQTSDDTNCFKILNF